FRFDCCLAAFRFPVFAPLPCGRIGCIVLRVGTGVQDGTYSKTVWPPVGGHERRPCVRNSVSFPDTSFRTCGLFVENLLVLQSASRRRAERIVGDAEILVRE